jgi:uncharacterized protein with NAD-binding domain and iron-sulfur cluster
VNSVERFDVAIAGGGLAGLTCGVALSQAGLRVAVIEREADLGGRARSWIDPVTGDPVTIGPHILLSEYPNMLKLLDILGTTQKIVWQKRIFVTMVEGRTRIPMKMSPLPAPFHFVPSLLRDPTLANSDWLSNAPITLFVLSIGEAELLELDNQRAIDVLRRFHVSARYMQRFWAFLSMSIMNVPLELCSAGAILRAYRRLIGQRGYRVGFAGVGLGDLFAGASADFITSRGGVVYRAAKAQAVSIENDRARGFDLDDGSKVRSHLCVAALPPQELLAIVPAAWREESPILKKISALQPSPYISVYLWLDRKLTNLSFWARLYGSSDLNLDFYDLSNIMARRAEQGSIIASNIIFSYRAADLSDAEIVGRTVAELAEFLPEARLAQIQRAVVNRIPMAIHAPFVGSEHLRPDPRTLIKDLFLTGDWIQTGLPASMESACMSGWIAAESVLSSLRRPKSLAIRHRDLDWPARMLGRVTRTIRRRSRNRRRAGPRALSQGPGRVEVQ